MQAKKKNKASEIGMLETCGSSGNPESKSNPLGGDNDILEPRSSQVSSEERQSRVLGHTDHRAQSFLLLSEARQPFAHKSMAFLKKG